MICCNSAFEQGNLDLWRYYINAFIIYLLLILLLSEGCVDAKMSARTGGTSDGTAWNELKIIMSVL